MKSFLQKYKFYILLFHISFIGHWSYGQPSLDQLLASSGILSEPSVIVASYTPPNMPAKVPHNAIDPIDAQSYSKMHNFQRLDKGWDLTSASQEVSIFQHEINRLKNQPSLPIDSGASLKKGMSEPRVRQLALALNSRGFLQSEYISDTFSAEIENAVKAAQKTYGLTSDGIAGKQTITTLSSIGDKKRLAALYWAVNNPRMSVHSSPKVVTINLASQQLRAYENGNLVLTSKVIIGTKSTQTPVMSDLIEAVTFNPIWNIPPGIAERSYNGERRSIAAGPIFIEYRPVEVTAQGIIKYHSDPYIRIPGY